MYLEGTSSMVLDRKNKIAYSCLSSRTNLEMLNIWSSERGYKIKSFMLIIKTSLSTIQMF